MQNAKCKMQIANCKLQIERNSAVPPICNLHFAICILQFLKCSPPAKIKPDSSAAPARFALAGAADSILPQALNIAWTLPKSAPTSDYVCPSRDNSGH